MGPFDYALSLLPASEKKGCIAISVSFGFSQSGYDWTLYCYGDIGHCITSMLISGPAVGYGLYKLTIGPLPVAG